jgi:serine/threonine protein kinase
VRLADLAAGVQIGEKYRLLEILGQGGYGDVWRALRLADGTEVALKFYRDGERSRGCLGREANLGRQFEHQNLVHVFDSGPLEGLYVMEMEYVPGETLSTRITASHGHAPPTLQEVLLWMEQIAAGLAYLHGRQSAVSHGDIKLDNLILTPTGTVKITDFGLSRIDPGEKFAPTDLGGTWLYMAPERLGLEREPAHCESDIYSFGVTIYRIVTGRFPRETANEVYTLTPFPRPCELNSAIPATMDDLICKCLEKKPEKRFANGQKLLAAIRELHEQLATPLPCAVPVGRHEPLRRSDGPYSHVERAYELAYRGEVEAALNCLNAALPHISTNPRILEFYAELNRKAGRLGIARSTFCRIVGWLDAHAIPVSERRQTLEQLGELQISEKDYEGAVGTYLALYETFQDDLWIKTKYGVALGLAARARDSIAILEEVRRLRPQSAVIAAKIGFAHLQLRNQQQAEQYFNEALMLDEFEPTALYHLAILKFIDGQATRAERYYGRLRQIEGQEAKARDLASKLGIS